MDFPHPPSVCLAVPKALSEQGYTLRHAQASDLPWMQAAYIDLRRDMFASAGLPQTLWLPLLQQQFEFQHRQYLSQHPQAWFMVLEHGGTPIGRYYLNTVGEEAVHILDILLLPASRSQGIGRLLLTEAIRLANARGQAAALMVEHSNHGAMRLYQSLGFVPQASTATHTRMVCAPSTTAMAVNGFVAQT